MGYVCRQDEWTAPRHRDSLPALQQGQERELPHQRRTIVQTQGWSHSVSGHSPGSCQSPGAEGQGQTPAGSQDGRTAVGGAGPGLLPAAHHGAHRDTDCEGQEESLCRDCAQFIENIVL